MIDYLNFNLTQYKSFRQLQLEYVKTKNLNQQLKYQNQQIMNNYHQKCKQLQQVKHQDIKQNIRLKNKNLKFKNLYFQLLGCIQANFSSFSHLKADNIGQEIFIPGQNTTLISQKIQQFTRQYISTLQQNRKLQRRLSQISSNINQSSLQHKKSQTLIVRQIKSLQSQLQQYYSQNQELSVKIQLRQKQCDNLRMENQQLYKQIQQINIKLLQQTTNNQNQDHQFAVDLLTFQNNIFQDLYLKLLQATSNEQLQKIMTITFHDFQELSQIFKQKLQIEYDLQQLQCTYKNERNKHMDEHILVEIRRQIETFRIQLLQQKQLMKQKELSISGHMQEYKKQAQQQTKLRNYSYELQNRLYKRNQIESCQKTAREVFRRPIHIAQDSDEQKSSLIEQQMIKKSNGLRFKQTNNVQEMMKEIVKKDKDNLDKILKDNRKTIHLYRPKS